MKVYNMNFDKVFRYITNRPFLMALIVFVVLFISYNFLFKKNKGSTAAVPPSTIAQAAIPTYGRPIVYNQEFMQFPVGTTPPGPIPPSPVGPPTPAPVPTWPKTGKVRGSTGSVYDNQYGGVYMFNIPATAVGGGTGVAVAPFNSTITLLGKVTGKPYGGTDGSTGYYQTAQGYISDQDVTVVG